ncbi:hypothetical protein PPMP20_19065 [Paraburkholderia phymatum]|nr:hypothetical protein [Paraburkholderia phymatum]
MSSVHSHRRCLALVDRHIAECQGRIARLEEIAAHRNGAGFNADECENLISVMLSVLDSYFIHRRQIIAMIDRQEKGPS